MPLPTALEASIRAYAAAHRLDAALQGRWLAWESDDAAMLLELAEALGAGGNHVGDFMIWLEEISAREGVRPAVVLRAPTVRGALAAPLGRSDKLKRVKGFIRARRYPRLARLEEALAGEARSLELGGAVTVRFPPGLEGDEVTVEVRARRPEELRNAVERLSAAVQGGRFERMFQLLDEVS